MRTLSDSADQKAICATLSGGILAASMTTGGSLGGYGLGPSRVSRLCGGEPWTRHVEQRPRKKRAVQGGGGEGSAKTRILIRGLVELMAHVSFNPLWLLPFCGEGAADLLYPTRLPDRALLAERRSDSTLAIHANFLSLPRKVGPK